MYKRPTAFSVPPLGDCVLRVDPLSARPRKRIYAETEVNREVTEGAAYSRRLHASMKADALEALHSSQTQGKTTYSFCSQRQRRTPRGWAAVEGGGAARRSAPETAEAAAEPWLLATETSRESRDSVCLQCCSEGEGGYLRVSQTTQPQVR